MNRQEALEWLVENVTKWPYSIFCRPSKSGWYWLLDKHGDSVFWCGKSGEQITQSDWLAATGGMPRKDCESVFE